MAAGALFRPAPGARPRQARPVHATIHLHPEAPPKPAEGAACNGCGVCCAGAPCPLGMLASRRRTGRCAALHWQEGTGRYVCGLIARPEAHLPRPLRALAPGLARLARRQVSAGSGCDCDWQPQP